MKSDGYYTRVIYVSVAAHAEICLSIELLAYVLRTKISLLLGVFQNLGCNLTFQSLPVNLRNAILNIQKFCTVITLYLYVVWFSEQNVTFALYSYIINRLIFVTEVESV
jgi:hypothetical protein